MKLFHRLHLHIIFAFLFLLYTFAFLILNLLFTPISELISHYLEVIIFTSIFFIYTSLSLFFHFKALKLRENFLASLSKFYKYGKYFYAIILSILIFFGVLKLIINIDSLGFGIYIFFSIICFILSIENKYLLQKIEEKKYLFPQQSFSESLQIISAILCIIFVLGAFYTRDLKIDIPKNYFDEYQIDVHSAHQVLLKDFQISDDLSDISRNISDSPESAYQKLKSDTQLLTEMRMLYEQYKDINIEKNTTYVYNDLFDLNRVKILYAQYEIDNKNINHGVEIYRNIFQNNQKILEANNGIIGSLVYLSVQKPSLESLNTHKYLFRESQQASILETIKSIDTQDIFKNAFSHEINTAHGYMKFVLKVPLFLDIYEMKKIDQYYKYTIIQNNGEMDENILFSPQFTRANYIGMFFLNTAQTQYTSQFQKFHELESIIAELKK